MRRMSLVSGRWAAAAFAGWTGLICNLESLISCPAQPGAGPVAHGREPALAPGDDPRTISDDTHNLSIYFRWLSHQPEMRILLTQFSPLRYPPDHPVADAAELPGRPA
jgi:hypothetical protein